ncbi:hypothetical protein Tco_1006101 [Tanacetum coccineum]|uniref:Uncharacterized protein n=1 Tax=Tanacetum coccineum TaxID=301880 RepID=A0ABQ5FI19_9ASTR
MELSCFIEEVFDSGFVQDFQDSPDDEEDTRSSQEYLNDLEEEYQERALLAKFKRLFKKGCQSPSQQKPKLSPTKDFEAKCNKVKAKLALLSSNTSSKSSMVNNKGLLAEAYEWDDEDVSYDDNEMTEVKVLMALADDENVVVGKESARNGFTLPNHDTGRILPAESQVKIVDPLVAITDSSATVYDSVDESSVCSTPLPPLEKLAGVEPVSGPKTIKSILKSNSTFKADTLKGFTINEPSSAPAKGSKNGSASKINSAPTSKLKNVKTIDDLPLFISLRRRIKARNPQHVTKSCKTCGRIVYTITDHNDIEWFRRGEALQAKKAEALQ